MRNSRTRKALSLITAFAITFLTIVPLSTMSAFAQATTGGIKGTVTDQGGAVVAGAIVTAKNEGTGIATDEFKTSGEGLYSIPNLIPGMYTVTVTNPGFSSTVTTGVEVRLGLDTQ